MHVTHKPLAAFTLLATCSAFKLPSCPLSFDGRIPLKATAATFVSQDSPFNTGYVHGQNITWDEIIEFPNVPPTRFDKKANAKPIGLTLTDASIFGSASEGVESALRRAELLVNNKDTTVSGHKTWHFSVRTDPTRPLNFSHEYVLAFHEAQDFQADFWSVKAGALLSANPAIADKSLRVEGYKWDTPVKTFFKTPLTDGVWHNFGVNLDFPNNMISIFYSTEDKPLRLVLPPTFNNISGVAPTSLGETHFGLQKRPVGADLNNFLFNGEQSSGINEALFLGGIFQDDSSKHSCVTL